MQTTEQGAAPLPRRAMTVAEVARYLSITQQSVWAAVRAGRLPEPVYPASRSPRWFPDEIDTAIERTRAQPRDAAAARRARRNAGAPADVAA